MASDSDCGDEHRARTVSFLLPVAALIAISLLAPNPTAAAPVTIIPAQIWPDDRGEHINAHCGGIIQVGDRYFWFGEYRNARKVQSIACYVSSDLSRWTFSGLVLTSESSPDVAASHLERPKVLYNERTKKFVMWMHRENVRDYNEAQCAVATCDTVDGKYAWQGMFNPNGNMSRDCTLFQDDDGSAYFLSSARNNADMIVYKLTDDYLKVAEQMTVLSPNLYREAPCLFKRDGTYYLITSFCTGTWPNTQHYSTARAMKGPWSSPRKLTGDDTWNTYYSQGAFVLTVRGSEKTSYLYCADRWQVNPMRHVWLPMEFTADGSIAPLRWADSWTLDAVTGTCVMPQSPGPLGNDLARSAIVTTDYKDTGFLQQNPVGDRNYSHLAGHEPGAANDGDPATYWCAGDNLPGHWWKVDLGAPQSISGVSLRWYRRANYGYRIEVSADDKTWESKVERTASAPTTRSAPPTRGAGITENFTADRVRFVRVTNLSIPSGYDWPGISDFKVYSVSNPTSDIAAGKPATADSRQADTLPAAAVDGDFATAWTIDDHSRDHWLKLDLGKPTDIAGSRILWEAPGFWYQYRIETSRDDKEWSPAVDQTSNTRSISQPLDTFTATGVRYVRLTLINYERGCWPGVRAFELLPPGPIPAEQPPDRVPVFAPK